MSQYKQAAVLPKSIHISFRISNIMCLTLCPDRHSSLHLIFIIRLPQPPHIKYAITLFKNSGHQSLRPNFHCQVWDGTTRPVTNHVTYLSDCAAYVAVDNKYTFVLCICVCRKPSTQVDTRCMFSLKAEWRTPPRRLEPASCPSGCLGARPRINC